MTNDERGADTTDLSLDACLELLANRHRRSIVAFFLETDADHASVDEVIAAIIDDEARATGERPGHDSVASALYHVHLPKFADAGVLDYDTRHLEIRYLGDPKIEEVHSKIKELQ